MVHFEVKEEMLEQVKIDVPVLVEALYIPDILLTPNILNIAGSPRKLHLRVHVN